MFDQRKCYGDVMWWVRHGLLQIATGITKCDDYYKLRQYIRFLWPELIGAVSAWNTHSHHVLDSGRWWYGHNHSIWAICIRFAKPTFHFSLSFTNLVIICGDFEFNAEASILFVIICYNDVRLSFHISFAPSVDTFFLVYLGSYQARQSW